MSSETKSLSIWAIFAGVLMLASLFIYAVRPPGETPVPVPPPVLPPVVHNPPPPVGPPTGVTQPIPAPVQPPEETPPGPVPPRRKPVVTVATPTGDLKAHGEVRIHFALDQPAPTDLQLGYGLVARPVDWGDRFSVEPGPAGRLVIAQGGRAGELVVKKSSPKPPVGPASLVRKEGSLTLSLSRDDRFDYAPDSRRVWEFPCAITELDAPYRVSVVSSRGFREKDARLNEKISVEFELDRAPADHPIPVRFRLGGGALPTDYEVVGRPRGDILEFPMGDRRTRLVLRRLPGPRGLGDREIRVECDPSIGAEVTLADGQHPIPIPLPDPSPSLTWSIEKHGDDARDPRGPATARLKVTIEPPPHDRCVFRYRISYPHRDHMREREQSIELDPPADPWATASTSAEQVLEFPPDDLVYPITQADDRAMKVRFEPIRGFPRPPAPLEYAVHGAEPENFSGRVLVLLVLTRNLVGADRPACRELQRFQVALERAGNESLRDGLVGRSIFVIERAGRIHRFRAEAAKDREPRPFPEGTRLAEILDRASKEAAESLFNRMRPEDETNVKKVLLLYDIADQEARPVFDALNSWLHGKGNWWVFWIDPDARGSALFNDAATIRAEADLNAFGAPAGGISEQLLDLLRGG